MTQLAYQKCPCGSGKKVKFCCCHDITAELDKLIRLASGEQRAAALDQVTRLVASKGPRAALLCLKAHLEFQLGKPAEARDTVDALVQAAPENPTSLMLRSAVVAMEAASGDDSSARREALRDAIVKFQRALERAEDGWLFGTDIAIELLCGLLVVQGEYLAARAHLTLRAAMMQDDQRSWEQLMSLMRLPLPVALKEEFALEGAPPAGAAWESRFQQVRDLESQARWLAAAEHLQKLVDEFPQEPLLLRHLGAMRALVAQTREAADAFHRFAALDNVPYDERVEAEALAQLLDRLQGAPHENVRITFEVKDTDRLMERLLSDRRSPQQQVDLPAGEGEPPPKAVFLLLDRPVPNAGSGLRVDELPQILGAMSLYGKQTDREARLEVHASRDVDLTRVREIAQEIGGDALSEGGPDEVTQRMISLGKELRWRNFIPEKLPQAKFQELMAENAEATIYRRWPQQPLESLDGRKPAEVAGQQAYQVRLAGAVLVLEMLADIEDLGVEIDFNRLRKELQLPPRELLTFSDAEAGDVPLVRLSYLKLDSLSDNQLMAYYQQAFSVNMRSAIYHLGNEVLRRGLSNQHLTPAQIWAQVTEVSRTHEQMVDLVRRGRELAATTKDRQLLQTVLMTELRMWLAEQDLVRFQQTVQDLVQQRFINSQDAAQILTNVGIAPGPAGSFAQPAAAKPQGLWTPDSAATAPGEKPRLWVPGMD